MGTLAKKRKTQILWVRSVLVQDIAERGKNSPCKRRTQCHRYNSISEINPEKETWKIMARVVRMWLVPDFATKKLPQSLELVLVDSEGGRIHGSVKRTLIYKFEKVLKEGCVYSINYFGVAAQSGSFRTNHHEYKITFQFGTKVEPMDDGSVPPTLYDFVPISSIVAGGLDSDYLVDVMGILTGVGTERENVKDGKKTKMNVIQLEDEGVRIECTLFGTYVDELNSYLASGEVQNTAVIVQLAKIKSFQEKFHIQNCMICTKLIFNPKCEVASQFTQRMIASMESPSQGLSQLTQTPRTNLNEEFLKISDRKTIEGIKDLKEDSAFVVFGTVKHIVEDDDWWYTACMCNKKVYPDSKMFFCEKCIRHVTKVALRYKLKVRVIDDTDSATFVIFDRDANMLINKTCQELFDISEKRDGVGSIPKEITQLVDKSFLFKVECKKEGTSRFDQSFRVKKICMDETIIQMFKDLCIKSDDANVNYETGTNVVVNLGDTNESGNDVSSTLQQDLVGKFSGVIECADSQMNENYTCDLSKDVEEETPNKNIDSSEVGEVQVVVNKLVKNIPFESGSSTQPRKCGKSSKLLEDVEPKKFIYETQDNQLMNLNPNENDMIVLEDFCGKEKKQSGEEVPVKILKKKIKTEKA